MLTPRGINLSYSIQIIDWLTENGFTPSMGARPMARLINEQIKKPLAKTLLFGNEITKVRLAIVDDAITIQTDDNSELE